MANEIWYIKCCAASGATHTLYRLWCAGPDNDRVLGPQHIGFDGGTPQTHQIAGREIKNCLSASWMPYTFAQRMRWVIKYQPRWNTIISAKPIVFYSAGKRPIRNNSMLINGHIVLISEFSQHYQMSPGRTVHRTHRDVCPLCQNSYEIPILIIIASPQIDSIDIESTATLNLCDANGDVDVNMGAQFSHTHSTFYCTRHSVFVMIKYRQECGRSIWIYIYIRICECRWVPAFGWIMRAIKMDSAFDCF